MLRQLNSESLASLYDESREKMPPDERERWLNHRLAQQVRYAYRFAPAVREMLDRARVSPSDIRSLADLQKLPVTSKDALVKLQHARPPFGGFLSTPASHLRRTYVSPGPIYDAYGLEQVRALARNFVRAGYPKPGDTVLVSTAFHMVPAGLLLTDALDLLGCNVVPAGTGQTEVQIKILHDLRATTVVAFPSYFMTMVESAEQMGFDFRRDFNVKCLMCGGERHIDKLRKKFEEDYGLLVVPSYSTAELGPVAYDCGVGAGYHYGDEDCMIEIVDPSTGKQVGPMEVGEVVVTPFSRVCPLIRFGTGDLASYTNAPCPCGRTSSRINGIIGMIGDHIRVKGMFVHLRELKEAMSAFPNLGSFQLVAELEGHRDKLTLRVEADAAVNRQAVASQIQQRCQDVFKLKVDKIEFLPRSTLRETDKVFMDTRW